MLKSHFVDSCDEHGGSQIALSYLVSQHKREILDTGADFAKVTELSFNKEFQNMILVCIFVPFLHEETPKPANVQKSPFSRDTEHQVTSKIT
jgi:hypothetical protein